MFFVARYVLARYYGGMSSKDQPKVAREEYHSITDIGNVNAGKVSNRLSRFAGRVGVRDQEIDDIVQETLTRAWAAKDTFKEGTNLIYWLNQILLNIVKDKYRANKSFQDMLDRLGNEVASDRAPGAHERVEALDLLRKIEELLPEQQFEALVLSARGFSQEEIASKMGKGEEAIESLLARGRRAVRDRLRESQAA